MAVLAAEVVCQCVPTAVSTSVCFIALWLVCGQYLHRPPPERSLASGGRWWMGPLPNHPPVPITGALPDPSDSPWRKRLSSVLSSYARLHNWLCDSSLWLPRFHLINWRLRFHPTENKALLDAGWHIQPPREWCILESNCLHRLRAPRFVPFKMWRICAASRCGECLIRAEASASNNLVAAQFLSKLMVEMRHNHWNLRGFNAEYFLWFHDSVFQ